MYFLYDKTKHRIKVIQAKDPLSFERQYNEAAQELDKYGGHSKTKRYGGKVNDVERY